MKKRIAISNIALIALFLLPGNAVLAQQTDYLQETTKNREARMAWWKEARFGMFIHWGVYSVLGGTYKGESIEGIGEWIMHRGQIPIEEYETYARMFNPLFFDAEAWVDLAVEAGMKYIVITSKHHDGFALWDSQVSDWDIMNASPFKRDILKELSIACEKKGIRLCFYHSIMDWHHPDAQAPFYPKYNDRENSNPHFPRYIEHYMKPQLKELLTKYGDIGILWFDGEWMKDYTSAMGKDIYQYVREFQPGIIINNRVDKGRKGMVGVNREGNFAGDYGTPEQEIPDTGIPGLDWESCMTMNRTWGWKANDSEWKSSEVLIRNLIDIVSKGGNYLLNVGPTHEGLIPKPSVERLKIMGKWLRQNGESIYGAEAGPFAKPSWGRYTKKPGKIYAHVFQWPEEGKLNIPTKNLQVTRAYLLADKKRNILKTEQTQDGLVIHLPNEASDPIASVVAIEHKY